MAPPPQWCRHAREHVVRYAASLWWCARCGAVWSGEVHESNGSRRWRRPQVSRERDVKDTAPVHAEDDDEHTEAPPLPRRTHCKRGHEYTPETTRHHNGGRGCLVCHREIARRWWRENKGRSRRNKVGAEGGSHETQGTAREGEG